jgi:serine/threonine protein kinase
VYSATDRHLNLRVAIKLLHPAEGGQAHEWTEAQRLEQLRSRFILPVLNADVIVSSDIRYIATPLVTLGDLEAASRPHGLSVARAIRYAQHVGAGLDTVHSAGMVHRDIKPANVLTDGDNALLADVAMCAMLDEDGRAERDGSWCTLAPEAAPDDGHCSLATDVYSLAATTFFLLSGEYPVDHRLPRREQQIRIASGDVRNIVKLAPHVPRSIGSVIKRGLNRTSTARYESAELLTNALVTALGKRRSWLRVNHEGHSYCAISNKDANHNGLGVCSEPTNAKSIGVRVYHLSTGRAVAGISASDVPEQQLETELQKLFTKLN